MQSGVPVRPMGWASNLRSKSELPGGELLHDLLGAAADRVDLHFAVDPLDLHAAHEARAAEDLHRFRGAESQRLGRLVLEQADIRDRIEILIICQATSSRNACEAAIRWRMSTSLWRMCWISG